MGGKRNSGEGTAPNCNNSDRRKSENGHWHLSPRSLSASGIDWQKGDASEDPEIALQRRCISVSFKPRFTFKENSRVRESAATVQLDGKKFVVVQRSIVGSHNALYRKNQSFWEHIPRGQACVFAVSGDEGNFEMVATLQGLRKFGKYDEPYGGKGEEPTTAVVFEAIDGVSGQLSAFCHNDEKYWIIGSTRRHIVLRFNVPNEDIEANKLSHEIDDSNVSGYNESHWCSVLTNRVAKLFQRVVRTLPKGKPEALHEFLSSNGYTACFDATLLDSGHIIDYGMGESLLFYAITKSGMPSSNGLCVDPATVTGELQSFGLRAASYKGCPPVVKPGSDAYVSLRESTARRLKCKGAVLYGMNDAGIVVRVWKIPSYVFFAERAAQETIVTHRLSGKVLREKLVKRIERMPKDLRQYLTEWKMVRMDTLVHFAAWLHITLKLIPNTDLNQQRQVRRRWISLQRQFKESMNDKLEKQVKNYEPSIVEMEDNDPDAIICVGPQGCGKSTFSRALFALLQQAGQKPRWLNQDEIGDRQSYLKAIRMAKDSDCTHIILDKMNLDDDARDSDYSLFNLKAIYVVWTHPEGTTKMTELCFERVLNRGGSHRTFLVTKAQREDATQRKRMQGIVRACVSRCRFPTEGFTVEADVREPTSVILAQVWEVLSQHGMAELPDIKTLNVEEAMELSREYESLLGKLPRSIVYGAIGITMPEKVIAATPPELLTGKRRQNSFHVTTIYIGNRMVIDPVLLVRLARVRGSSIELTLEYVASDLKATAIAVRNQKEFYTQNAHPHITVATVPGVPAKYSNELLDNSHKSDPNRTIVKLPPGTTVSGVFDFFK
ncbi:Fungal tRNA ligase phosphodiesterase domain [Trypanosoma vivax]|nr:Fungal tRNA ligase phosphodiesterase domain [Trypanosoma vivax]